VAAGVVLGGCAPAVMQEPAGELQPAATQREFRVLEETAVSLSTGYKTRIKPRTTWRLVGSIVQGDVYKSADQVLAVEGKDVHEAYLVLVGDELIGFYLPVERTIAPVSPAKQLRIER
jgi:hypothetical protein